MTPLISLTRALSDPALFGGTFRAPSFWTWRVVAKLVDGEPLREAQGESGESLRETPASADEHGHG